MPANQESGFTSRNIPSWHRDDICLTGNPRDLEHGRLLALPTAAGKFPDPENAPEVGTPERGAWDVFTEGVFRRKMTPDEFIQQVRTAIDIGDDDEALHALVDQAFPQVDNVQATVRDDTDAVLGFGTDRRETITNVEFFEAIATVLGADKGLKLDTAGAIHEGRGVYATVYLPDTLQIDGDPSATRIYLNGVTWHDGTGAMKFSTSTVRQVCANTVQAAEWAGEQEGTLFVFRHTASWREQVDQAREVVFSARENGKRYQLLANDLQSRPITRRQREDFLSEFIPKDPTVMSDRVQSNVDKAREQVRDILNGPTCIGIDGTAYGLFSAAVEYRDHRRRYHNASTLFDRTVLTPDKAKTETLALINEILDGDAVEVPALAGAAS